MYLLIKNKTKFLGDNFDVLMLLMQLDLPDGAKFCVGSPLYDLPSPVSYVNTRPLVTIFGE